MVDALLFLIYIGQVRCDSRAGELFCDYAANNGPKGLTAVLNDTVDCGKSGRVVYPSINTKAVYCFLASSMSCQSNLSSFTG